MSVLIDHELFQTLSEALGQEALADLVALYQTSSEETLAQLQSALALEDMDRLKSLAHKLKGSSANLGLVAVQQACINIEQATSQGAVSPQLIKELEKQVLATLEELESLMR